MSRRAWGRYNIQNQLMRELRRAAREAERQRGLMEKQRRQEEQRQRLQKRRSEVLNKLRDVENLKRSLVTEDLLVYMDTYGIDDAIKNINARINSTDRLTELNAIKAEIGRIERQIKADKSNADSRKKQHEFEEEQKRLNKEKHEREIAWNVEKIRSLRNEVNNYLNQEYPKIMGREIQSVLFNISDIEHTLSSEDAAVVKERLKNIERSFNDLKREVESKLSKWEEEISFTEELINKAEFELKLLEQDKVTYGWCKKEIEELYNQLNRYSEEFSVTLLRYDFQALMTSGAALEEFFKQCTSVRELSSSKEEQEKQRVYVVNGIMDVLSEMGFSISQGPNLVESNNPSSTVVLGAGLPTGKNIEVKVNLNGAIYSDFSGYSGDECVGDMSNFRNKLLNNYSVAYEIRGAEGTNPNKIKKGARGVPDGANYNSMKS